MLFKAIIAVFPKLGEKTQLALIIAVSIVVIAGMIIAMIGINKLIKALDPIAKEFLEHGFEWNFGNIKVPRPSDPASQVATQPSENTHSDDIAQ